MQAGTFFKKSLLFPSAWDHVAEWSSVGFALWTREHQSHETMVDVGWGTANSICLLKLHHFEKPVAQQLDRGPGCTGAAVDSSPDSAVCVTSCVHEGPEVLCPRLWGGPGVSTQVQAERRPQAPSGSESAAIAAISTATSVWFSSSISFLSPYEVGRRWFSSCPTSSILFFSLYIFLKNQNKVALQCHVSFYCTTVWIGYLCIYIASLLNFPSHLPNPLGHHRSRSWAPCDIQQLSTSSLFYLSVYVNATLSIHPTFSFRPVSICPFSRAASLFLPCK